MLFGIVERKIFEATARTANAIGGLRTSFASSVQRANTRFSEIASRLTPATLKARSTSIRNQVEMFDQRRFAAVDRSLKAKAEGLNVQMAKLNALSPLAVLTRGYSITQLEDGGILRDPSQVKSGDKLKIRLERGKLDAEVLAAE
jgi:exodeoxyribonuclease VII large subunit